MAISKLMLGESLVGDGNEVAHVDLMIGPKEGPAGHAFAHALSSQREGHNTLLAVIAPNLPCKPDTVLFNKVTIKGAKQAVQMFGPAQAAVARAVADCVQAGDVPGDDNLCILVGVFIHWDANDDQKIFDFNYRATREALTRAVRGEPTAQTVTSKKGGVQHPFASGSEKQLEKAEFQRTPR
jgi:5,6,7,8-tetrahydromethanopterin hydro-lyase